MFRDEDVGRFLFHYTTTEVFLGHILPSGRLRFSPFAEMNDPRESKDWTCSLTVDEGENDEWDLFDITSRFTSRLKSSAKVLCFSRDDRSLDPNRAAHLYGRGYSRSRMWDRYAGGHSGVCLAYAIDTLGEDIARDVGSLGDLRHMGISYDDMPRTDVEAFNLRTSVIRSLGIDAALDSHQKDHFGALYLYKSTDWASENEYRWVLLSNQSDRYVFADVRRSLAGVIFGPDYPEESIPMVRDVLADDSVVLARIHYQNGSPIPLPAV